MTSKVIFTVLGTMLTIVSSQPVVLKSPVLETSSNEVLFTKSKPFNLNCDIIGNANQIHYSWTKDGEQLDLSQSPNVKQNEGSLTFEKPISEDAGVYRCFAKSALGIAKSKNIAVNEAFIEIPSVITKRHKPVEGKPFKLECDIPHSYPKPTITWMNQSESNPSDSTKILNRRILQDPSGNLWFSNVTTEDISKLYKYVCVAKTPAAENDVVLIEHYLEDLETEDSDKGELIEQYLTEDITVKAGYVTMIYCIYGGTPLAHPDWFKDGKNVNNSPGDRVTRYNRSSGRRLLIRDTYLEDEGTYTCQVDNGAGQPQSHSMFLTVVSAPAFSSKLEPRTSAKKGQDITITCQVYGRPLPNLTWTYNAKPLENPDVHISTDQSGNKTVANLEIKNVQEQHKGYYGCEADNEYGNIYAETLLEVL